MYDRVNQSDAGSDVHAGAMNRSRGERLTDKLVAFGWLLIAMLTARWTKFYAQIWSGDDINRGLLHLGVIGIGVVVSLALYLTVYLPRVKGLADSSAWSVYCPYVIPSMTATGIITTLILIRSFWDKWGFLSPLILGTQCMGCIMSLHFIPAF